MATELSDEARKVRELAVAELQGIELALREAGDIEASEIVMAAVKKLQATLVAKDSKGTLLKAASSRLKGAAASVGASVQSATDTAATAVRAGANRIASEGMPVKATLDKASSLAQVYQLEGIWGLEWWRFGVPARASP